MVKCGKACTACPYIKEGKAIRINQKSQNTQTSQNIWTINAKLNCESYNVVYMIECDKNNCQERYIGESGRSLKYRLAEHRGYIANKVESKATGAHFNQPGHSLANLKVTIIEQVRKPELQYRKQRENYFIRHFNTYYNGMNRQQ